MGENEKVFWMIERSGRGFAEKWLAFRGSQSVQVGGIVEWTKYWEYALHFRRRQDAVSVASLLITLAEEAPHGTTLPGLRSGDPFPEITEHSVMGGEWREATRND